MENEEQNLGNQPNPGALSIYGQTDAAMDDFPVLKAFQQYIDAEQSKSRKRMILLCMFFGALMTILVSVFFFMLAQVNRDKQHVNDQLIEFLMKERDRGPTTAAPQSQAVVQPASNPAQDAALKAMTETLSALQQQMAEQKKAAEEAAVAQPTKAEIKRAERAEREEEKLRRAQEKLDAEKRALAEEKEKLRQAEIERQRRRLYPEYYQRQTPATPTAQPPSVQPAPKKKVSPWTDEDIDDILREVDSLKARDEERARREKKAEAKKTDAKKDGDKTKKSDKSDVKDQPIEYFTDSEYALPVKVDGEDSSWSLPLK